MTLHVTAVRFVHDDALRRHPHVFGDESASRAIALAHAVAASTPWERMRRHASLVVRPEPTPLIGIVGTVKREDRVVLDALGDHVDSLLARLRPLDYPDVQQACRSLARQLESLLGSGLAKCRLIAIPRGGLIVAGLLAYELGLRGDQVGNGLGEADGPIIVVDDCVLTGARLHHWLRNYDGPPVIVAHLASVPACRKMVVASEPKVAVCIAAIDLHDHADERYESGWRERWRDRTPGAAWIGEPDHVVFPWNEPDAGVWNPLRAHVEKSWRVVPPQWCLKNRTGADDAIAGVQVLRTGKPGPHSPADDVVWATLDGAVIVAAASGDRAVRLAGAAAESWHQLVALGEATTAAAAVATHHQIDESRVQTDMTRLVAQLAARNLLVGQ